MPPSYTPQPPTATADPAGFVAHLIRFAFAADVSKVVARAAVLVAVEVIRRDGVALADVVARLTAGDAGKAGER